MDDLNFSNITATGDGETCSFIQFKRSNTSGDNFQVWVVIQDVTITDIENLEMIYLTDATEFELSNVQVTNHIVDQYWINLANIGRLLLKNIEAEIVENGIFINVQCAKCDAEIKEIAVSNSNCDVIKFVSDRDTTQDATKVIIS